MCACHTVLYLVFLVPTVLNDLSLTVIQEKLQISIRPLPLKVNFMCAIYTGVYCYEGFCSL